MTNNLRHLRAVVGLSQQRLAKEARISQGTISAFENGRARLTVSQFERVEAAVYRVIESKAETLTLLVRALHE